MNPSEPGPPSRRTAAVIGALGLLLMVVCHVHGHLLYLDHLDTDHTRYAPPSLTSSGPSADPASPAVAVPAGARRLWVLVIDGLREDVAAELPHLRRLAARGARRPLLAEFPTFTFPNLNTMSTGVLPRYSGVRMNSALAAVPLRTLFDVARAAGVPTLLATEWPPFEVALDRRLAKLASPLRAADLLHRPPARELAWIHFDDVDRAGHSDGAASAAYRAAALRGDELLGALAGVLDPARDVLVALSDHGHRDRGGHGGVEPEVQTAFFLAFGAGVKRGALLPQGRMRDVCATLALLAGLPPPADNLGAPMLDLLDATPAQQARALAPAWVQRAAADAALAGGKPDPIETRRIASALVAGDPAALASAGQRLAAREAAVEADYGATLALRTRARLLGVAAAVALIGLLSRWARRSGALVVEARDLLPGAIYAAVFGLLFVGRGYPLFGWSAPRGAGAFMAETAIIGVLAGGCAVLCGRLRLIRGPGRPRPVEQSAAVVVLWGIYLFAAAVDGGDPAWLAGPSASFAPVLASTVLFYLAGALGITALVVALRRPSALSEPPGPTQTRRR